MSLLRKRFFAFIIDCLICTMIYIIIIIMINTDDSFLENREIKRFFYSIILLVYLFFSELFFHKTIGKKIFRLKVVFKQEELFFMSILIRSFSRLIPLDGLSFLLSDKKDNMWHDILSKTRVVFDIPRWRSNE